MERTIFVYIDVRGKQYLTGKLWTRVRNGRESASFEYDKNWLKSPDRFALDPALLLVPGPFHTVPNKSLFGAIGDSAPDRWGRVLMRRYERHRSVREGKPLRTLFESDFLLSVDDEARQGALRFSEKPGGPFLAEPTEQRIPPLVELPRLLKATERVLNDTENDDDIRLLLAPGSSLGGARPKASVRDKDGTLAIAKFLHPADEVNVVLWEALALELAKQAGITVSEWKVAEIVDKRVLIIRRFDRKLSERIPFISSMSMLEAYDHEMRSYLEIADALRRHGAAPESDLKQLWRRILFSVLISNTDDHLRNHGFLYAGNSGWKLSPAYDVNPVPIDVHPRVLSTCIDLDNPDASVELAFSTAEYYGISTMEAKAIALEIASVTKKWHKEAARLGIPNREIDRMASAFEHDDLHRLTGKNT